MKDKKSSGSALLLSTILLFVVLGLVVSLSYVTVMEQKMSQKTKSSVGSFFNADSGVEWALNKIANGSGTIASVFTGFTSGKVPCPAGFSCEVYLLGADGKVIINSGLDLSEVKAVRAVGTQTAGEPTQRAIEAAVAQASTCSGYPKNIESADNTSATLWSAISTCRSKGSCWAIPTQEDILLFRGIASASSSFLWTRTANFGGAADNFAIIALSGSNSVSADSNPGSSSRPFRCVDYSQ